jgi:hypothetical protein
MLFIDDSGYLMVKDTIMNGGYASYGGSMYLENV